MANEAGILFHIRGDSKDAEAAFDRTQKAASGLTGSTTGLTAAFAKGSLAGDLLHDAITKIADVAVQAIPALFNLARTTGEYADKIYDAAQKTDVGTDSLQALKVAADQSGSSFETVEKSLTKFSVLLGQAAMGNDKAEKTLKAYGITAKDTDGALLQAIKTIDGYSSATVQNAAAAELFKDKSGAMINIIREIDGDLEGFTTNLKKTGQIMGKDAVKAGADFTDQMDDLEKQLAAVGRSIGEELIPVFSEMASDVSTWLRENQGEVKTWGRAFATTISAMSEMVLGFSLNVQGLAIEIEALRDIAGGSFQDLFSEEYKNRAANRDLRRNRINLKLQGQGADLPAPFKTPTLAGTGMGGNKPIPFDAPYTPVFVDKTGRPRDLDAEQEAAKEAEKRRKEREAAAKRDQDAQSRYLDLQIKAIREHFQDVQAAAEKAFIERLDTEEQFIAKSKKALGQYKEDTTVYLGRAFDIDAQGKTAEEIQNLRIAKGQAIAAIEREIGRQQADNAKLVTSVNKQTEEERKKALEGWQKARDAQKEVQKTEAEIIDAGAEDRAKQVKHWNERRKAQKDIYDIQTAGDDAKARDQADLDELGLGDLIASSKRGIGGGFLDVLGVATEDVLETTDIMGDAFTRLGNLGGEMFEGLASGVGSMVEAWVLYGSAGPDALRKMTASLLANLAAQAAVEAIMETARGFAALAKYMGVPTPESIAHFTAAAIFGSVAVGAAVAGRLVAGDSFSKGGASSKSNPSDLSRQQAEEDRTAISRYSSTSGTSGRTWEAHVVSQMLGLSQAVDGLNNKIGSMQPHEVMTRAENQRPGITASHTINGVASNGGLGTRLQRVTGARR